MVYVNKLRKLIFGDSRISAEGHQQRLWVRKPKSHQVITPQHIGMPQSTVKVTKNEGSREQGTRTEKK
jgi:hypothetical protein